MFLLPHVIGSDADLFVPAARSPLLTAVAYAQLLFLASSAKRSYTERELRIIFDNGFKKFIDSLETLHLLDYNARRTAHVRNPRAAEPNLHNRPSR
jgi:hypothetical protein